MSLNELFEGPIPYLVVNNQKVILAKTLGLVLGYSAEGQKLVSLARGPYWNMPPGLRITLVGAELRAVKDRYPQHIPNFANACTFFTVKGAAFVLAKTRKTRISADTVVYFVQGELNCNIKIGSTSNLKRRLSSLQNSSPTPLTLLCSVPGSKSTETRFHDWFQPYRLWGEWFSPAPELTGFIDQVQKGLTSYPWGTGSFEIEDVNSTMDGFDESYPELSASA